MPRRARAEVAPVLERSVPEKCQEPQPGAAQRVISGKARLEPSLDLAVEGSVVGHGRPVEVLLQVPAQAHLQRRRVEWGAESRGREDQVVGRQPGRRFAAGHRCISLLIPCGPYIAPEM